MIQKHSDVDLLSGCLWQSARRPDTCNGDCSRRRAAAIICDRCLRSDAGFPDVLVVDDDPKFTSELFRAFVKSMGSCESCLIVDSAYHNNTNVK
jgi:hypothetical protein